MPSYDIELFDSDDSSSWDTDRSASDSDSNMPVRMRLPNRLKKENKKLKEENEKLYKKYNQLKKNNHKLITRFKIIENNFKDASCSICLEVKGEKVVTYCGHLFHEDCLKQWGKKNNCPVCRGNCETNLFKVSSKPITKVVGYVNELKIE